MSQELNPSICSSLVIFMHWACENHTFSSWRIPTWMSKGRHTILLMQRQLRGYNNILSFLQWIAPVTSSFCEGCTWHDLHILFTAPHFLWLEGPISKCAKLHIVAPSNHNVPTSCSFCFCLFAPHIYGCCSSRTYCSWWDAHSTQRKRRGATLVARLGKTFWNDWVWKRQVKYKLRKLRYKQPLIKRVKQHCAPLSNLSAAIL